jgi:transcriptional regulator GlxA family with amidase domain
VFEAKATRAWAEIQSSALVTAALVGVLRALDDLQNGTSPEPMPVSRVRVMVQNQLGDATLTVRRLATQTGYTADYLSNLFSVATGEHLSAYINRLRVERAAHLLRESALAVKEIAWACGFSSPSYFIRAFRAHFGQSPKAWRLANT